MDTKAEKQCFDKEQNIHIIREYLPHISQIKRKNGGSTVQTPGRSQLDRMSKVNSTSDVMSRHHHAPLDLMHQEEHSILSAASSQHCMA